MIEKKVEGHEIKAVPATPRRTGQVVDIFATLKKSLIGVGERLTPSPPSEPCVRFSRTRLSGR
jgi:non-homologous end joining protein Ku